jgi:hypothetical protein
VANDWQKHPGNLIEWHSATDSRHEGSSYYSAAAGTMGSAIIEGFFGVELNGQGVTLQPRLGLNDGFIRVYQAATDRYAAYSYDWDQNITRLDYGTNAAEPVQVKVLKLRSEQVNAVTVDGQPLTFETEKVGNDTYIVFTVPSGQHRVELNKGQPLVQPAALQVEAAATPINPAHKAAEPPRASVSPNLAPTPEPSAPAEAAQPNLLPETAAQPTDAVVADLSPDQTKASTLDPASQSERMRYNRHGFFRFIGVSLVITTSMMLLVLVALRRVGGLGR